MTKAIIQAIARACTRWGTPDFPPRLQTVRAVAHRLGYVVPVVDLALDRLFGSITQAALEATIVDELGSLQALDGFVARKGLPSTFARGVDNVLIISSDAGIGIAIPPMLFALCARAHVLVKDRSDQLIAAFAQTLIEEEPQLADLLRVQTWENHAASHAAIAQADVVVAFGRDETMREIRSRCAANARFIPFGHRTSVGYIAREALADASETYDLARAAALDALLYDGDGCLSPHAIFAERGGALSPDSFAATLARACDDVAGVFPAAASQADARVATYRDRMRFRADALGLGAVLPGSNGPHLVVFDPPREEPPPLLPRTIGVYPIDSPEEMLSYVRSRRLPLEAIGAAPSPGPELLTLFIAAGASRIATLGRLQDPPLAGNHCGYKRITPFATIAYRDA
jgi:Acyl-CoA reductase (LuxC)